MAFAALGSDTGGSIRQPAFMCGVVGLKPTYGRVSRYGLIAFASSLDQIGPFTKDVADAALMMEVICQPDGRDSTCAPLPVPCYTEEIERDPLPLRVGVPREYFGEGLDPEVEAAVRAAIGVYAGLGAEIVEVSLPTTEYAVATYYIVAPAEASSNLARYDGVHYGYRSPRGRDILTLFSRSRAEGFGPEVQRRILLGAYALSAGYYDAYYLKAARVRRLIKQDFDAAFARADVLACPTAPTAAFRFGEKDDPLAMYLADVFTIPANMAGIAAVSLPCGYTASGLPIGLQLIGQAFDEARLLRAGRAYEAAATWKRRRPTL
jgi:aspartyl-tRNA(Asn)/glutamyl-tRNA(Gln) amidotransferase subunit A